MSFLMILFLAVIAEFFLIFVAIRDMDRRIREYEEVVRLMSAYLGRPCVNLVRDVAELLAKNKKEV